MDQALRAPGFVQVVTSSVESRGSPEHLRALPPAAGSAGEVDLPVLPLDALALLEPAAARPAPRVFL